MSTLTSNLNSTLQLKAALEQRANDRQTALAQLTRTKHGLEARLSAAMSEAMSVQGQLTELEMQLQAVNAVRGHSKRPYVEQGMVFRYRHVVTVYCCYSVAGVLHCDTVPCS
jgi:chromosome segregation ATPase